MANPDHLEILYQGVAVWNRWRAENPGRVSHVRSTVRIESSSGAGGATWVNRSGVDLSHADLIDWHLSGIDLNWVNLSVAKLRFTRLRGAALTGANLEVKKKVDAFWSRLGLK